MQVLLHLSLPLRLPPAPSFSFRPYRCLGGNQDVAVSPSPPSKSEDVAVGIVAVVVVEVLAVVLEVLVLVHYW